MAGGITVPIPSIETTQYFALPTTTARRTRNFAFSDQFITLTSAPILAQPAKLGHFNHTHVASAKNEIAESLDRGRATIADFLPSMKLEVGDMWDKLGDAIKAEEDRARIFEHLHDFLNWGELNPSESIASMPDSRMRSQALPDDDDDDGSTEDENDKNCTNGAILEESKALRHRVRSYCKNVECVLLRGKAWKGDECPEAGVFGLGGIAPGSGAQRQPCPSTFLGELKEEKELWETLWQGCWVAWERFLHLQGRMTTLAKLWKIDGYPPETEECC
ncbi:MAG: hypothetical protein Q9187_000519 [Circinaria calcarea]